MDTIEKLKTQARELRDERIQQAKDDYEDTLREISELARKIAVIEGRAKPKIKGILQMVRDVVPKNREFTLAEILNAVRNNHPDLDIKRLNVRNALSGMVRQCELRRTQHGTPKCKSPIFAHSEYDAPLRPFGDQTQTRLIEVILRDEARSMNVPEIIVEMMERGFPVEDMEKLNRSIPALLRQKPQVFRREGDGWRAQ